MRSRRCAPPRGLRRTRAPTNAPRASWRRTQSASCGRATRGSAARSRTSARAPRRSLQRTQKRLLRRKRRMMLTTPMAARDVWLRSLRNAERTDDPSSAAIRPARPQRSTDHAPGSATERPARSRPRRSDAGSRTRQREARRKKDKPSSVVPTFSHRGRSDRGGVRLKKSSAHTVRRRAFDRVAAAAAAGRRPWRKRAFSQCSTPGAGAPGDDRSSV